MDVTVNGAKAYVYTGTQALEPNRRTWLFIHGAGMDHSVWILQSRYFAFHQQNVLAVDLPGHGRSEGAPLQSIEAQADWFPALLDAMEVDKAIVVGHSMGSLVALDFTARYPQRVQALALTGTGFPMAVAEPLLDAAKANDHRAVEMIMHWGLSPQSHLGGNQAPGLWLRGQGVRLLERAAPGVLFTDLNACNAYAGGLQRAAEITCPVHFVAGDKDMMTPPKAAAALAEAVTAPTSWQLLRGCGHMTPIERPNELLDELSGFGSRVL
ncbi:alpha/beta hydrolase [Aquisalimonas sp.]|uniref:alpha/beta fold hydrolase n=1 Tax=Aquisalimonas sp. TaxID=1872621 RepID=UPI0025C12383|nr:alpha/beta hydrolase [Aquisalimonas sp.]